MAHISRKELKKDEVRETLAHGADAVLSHKQFTTYILLAAVVVAVGFFGWKTYAERQTMKAGVGLRRRHEVLPGADSHGGRTRAAG